LTFKFGRRAQFEVDRERHRNETRNSLLRTEFELLLLSFETEKSKLLRRSFFLGCVRCLKLNFLSISSRQYVPMVDDMVIGIIVERLGENYRVDIGSAAYATLPILGFDGATKKTRPQLNVRICDRSICAFCCSCDLPYL
jgi:hypothetical protein